MPLFIIKLGVVLWAMNRGFELGDEGFLLLNTRYPLNTPPNFEIYKVLASLGIDLDFKMIYYRLINVVLELASALFLSWSVYRWGKRKIFRSVPGGFILFVCICLLGTFLSVMDRGLSYSYLTNYTTFFIAGALFYIASIPVGKAPVRSMTAILLVIGMLTGFQLIIKYPAAILFILIVAVFLFLIFEGPSLKIRVYLLVAYIVGITASICLIILSNQGLQPLLAKYRLSHEINELLGYGVTDILMLYFYYDIASHMNMALLLLSFGLAYFISRLIILKVIRLKSHQAEISNVAALIIACSVLAYGVSVLHPEYVSSVLIFLFCTMLFIPCFMLIVYIRSEGLPNVFRSLFMLLVLLLLPFINIVGSNVALTLKLPAHITALFILTAVLLLWLRFQKKQLVTYAVLLSMVTLTSCYVFVQHRIYQPFGIPSPIFEQKYPVPELGGIKVDRDCAAFLQELDTQLHGAGYENGDPVIALNFMAGLVYYLGGYSPSFNFYSLLYTDLNCYSLKNIEPDVRPYLLIGSTLNREQEKCLRSIEFPYGYRQVAVLDNPYGKMFSQYYGSVELPRLYIFAPVEP